jgi:hypothetical protein
MEGIMILGFYRGRYGDLYKVEAGKYIGLLVKNLSTGTESVMMHGDVRAQIDSGWLVKITVSDLGSDTTRQQGSK